MRQADTTLQTILRNANLECKAITVDSKVPRPMAIELTSRYAVEKNHTYSPIYGIAISPIYGIAISPIYGIAISRISQLMSFQS
jgi:hypothetical protein